MLGRDKLENALRTFDQCSFNQETARSQNRTESKNCGKILPKYYQFSSRLPFTHILSSLDDSIRSMFSALLLQTVSRHWVFIRYSLGKAFCFVTGLDMHEYILKLTIKSRRTKTNIFTSFTLSS